MSNKTRKTAKGMIIFELFFAIVILLSYLWLINILVGIFLILFLAMVVTWAVGLVFSILLFKKSKKAIIQEKIDAVELGGTDGLVKTIFKLPDREDEQ